MGRLVHSLVVNVNKDPKNNSSFFYKRGDGSTNEAVYPFKISKQKLIEIGKCIQNSRAKVPVSFQGSWDDLCDKIDGARAIDFLDFLLYVVPTLIVPLISRPVAKKALVALVRGCAIAEQWKLTEGLIVEMEE
jgi:hypothetical protein